MDNTGPASTYNHGAAVLASEGVAATGLATSAGAGAEDGAAGNHGGAAAAAAETGLAKFRRAVTRVNRGLSGVRPALLNDQSRTAFKWVRCMQTAHACSGPS